eukprot:2348349-Rhodomonas_salina.4
MSVMAPRDCDRFVLLSPKPMPEESSADLVVANLQYRISHSTSAHQEKIYQEYSLRGHDEAQTPTCLIAPPVASAPGIAQHACFGSTCPGHDDFTLADTIFSRKEPKAPISDP